MDSLRTDAVDHGILHVTAAPALRRCWHPVAFADDVGDAPIGRRLLGVPVVLWRPAADVVAAAVDRCPHRWSPLSTGRVVEGELECPYHGWRFDDRGQLAAVPQLPATASTPPSACLQRLDARRWAGMIWVRLESGGDRLPVVPELDDPTFRSIRVGAIDYTTSAPVIIDNNTDATHIAYVHAGSFGADQDPRIPVSTATRTDFGIRIDSAEMPVARTPTSQRPGSRRASTEIWLPFTQVTRLHYSDGATHVLLKGCCPVDDGSTTVHLTVLRNDVNDPQPAEAIVEFELAVEREDRAILDTIPAGFPLDPRLQAHVKFDRPGIAYRHALAEHVGHREPEGSD
ncbi:MAG: Rieske 2Fe-2S domain-containing protein [Actinomycetota bacterium]